MIGNKQNSVLKYTRII